MNKTLLHLTYIITLLCYSTLLHAQASEYSAKLPVIHINGDFGYEYQTGTFSIEYTDGTKENNLSASIKWRGGTTNTDDKHKRNYTIKFTEDHGFMGMRSDNKWILDAGQADVFRLRNRIATELWGDFAAKPYYSASEPKAKSYVSGNVVEVYVNDEYMGVYCLTECLDRKQMKLKKFSAGNTIHGVLWKSSGYGCSTMTYAPASYDNTQPTMDVFEAKYPELDDLPETDYSVLWNAINFVANSSNSDFSNHVEEYFDVPVLADYYIFVQVLNALDNCGKNMYWAVYDKMADKKITPAIWDLDQTVGSHSLAQYNPNFTSPEYKTGNIIEVIGRLKVLNVNSFNQKVNDRYAELRKTHLSPESLIARYDHYYNLLKETGAAERETERWSGDSDINGLEINFDDEITYIRNWITERIKYLDEKVFNYKEPTAISNITDTTETRDSRSVYDITGKCPTPRSNDILIHNGMKTIRIR